MFPPSPHTWWYGVANLSGFHRSFGFTNPAVAAMSEAFIDWLTDVTKPESVEFLGDVAWSISAVGFGGNRVVLDIGDDMRALKEVAEKVLEAFEIDELGDGAELNYTRSP